MAFPYTPLDQRIELNLGGTWTNITTRVQRRDSLVTIRRGRSDEASSVERSVVGLALNNRSGDFSPRNPTGTYYGQIGRNTPLRVSLPNGETYLNLTGDTTQYVSCPDAAALDITGDIDVRIEITPMSWRRAQFLTSKYGDNSGPNDSWALIMQSNGTLLWWWNEDGTFTGFRSATSTAALPIPTTGRQAVRATLDVNNGAGGCTVTFYYADSISGSWTQLGDAVTDTGTSAIRAGTSRLDVGGNPSAAAYSSYYYMGRVHKLEVRNGIAGSVVANPNFTTATAGATSFADTAAAPNTWTITSPAVLDDRDYRAHVEVLAWPTRWDTSGNDIWTDIEGVGILRRLGQGSDPLRGSLYRSLTASATSDAVAYWPCEDGTDATVIASAVSGVRAMTISGTPTFAATTPFDASDALPTFGGSIWTGTVPAYTDTSGNHQTQFLLAIPSGGMTTGTIVCRMHTTGGTLGYLDLIYTTTAAGTLTVKAYDPDGTLLATHATTATAVNGTNQYVSLYAEESGADCYIGWGIVAPGDVATTGGPQLIAATTMGRISRVIMNPGATMTDAAAGHISVHPSVTVHQLWSGAHAAYMDEVAGERIERLCGEEGIAFRWDGLLSDTATMGPQRIATLLTLLQDAADADGGILYEPRDVFGLGYRPRTSLYNQGARATLDYSTNELFEELTPTDDDRYTVNDVTASRTNGSSARYTQSSGTLNVNDPADDPDGVGRYPQSVSLNVADDDQLPDIAAWRVHLGTVDEPRFPAVTVNLANQRIAADTALVADVSAVDVGDRIVITNPPSWLPGDIEQLVQYSTETLGNFERSITWNCSPASPWNVAYADDTTYARADTADSELAEALTTTETDVDVWVSDGPLWATTAVNPSEFPFSATFGGEEVSVTACTSSVSDAFGRTVANGWGTPDVGAAYSTSGGVAGDYAVSGGIGTHTLSTVNVGRRTSMAQVVADFDLQVDIATSATATGDILTGSLVARCVDGNNLYAARIAFGTTQTVVLSLRKRVAGVETQLATYTATHLAPHVAGTFYRVRFQGEGTALRARVWAVGTPEPGAWQVTATDSDFTAAAQLGVRSISGSGNTNVNPVVRHDNFASLNPQTFTVTRSANDVVKAQTSGTDGRLTHPAITAL